MYEYDLAEDYLKRFKAKKAIVVPGNHDASNMGYELFENMFKTRFPVYEGSGVVIQGVDSSEPDIDDGHIGRESYHYITDSLSDKDNLRILALHHHLIPIPGTGRERQIPTDAGDVLGLCAKLGDRLRLFGPQAQAVDMETERRLLCHCRDRDHPEA
jgi:Icc protein